MAVQFRAHVVDGMSRDPGSISKSNQLQEALRSAAQATLTNSVRKSPGWYEAARHLIEPTIIARNAALAMYNRVITLAQHGNSQRGTQTCELVVKVAKKLMACSANISHSRHEALHLQMRGQSIT